MGPCAFSASASVFCASVNASANLPARSSSMILLVWAATLCADAGVTTQALAASASPSSNPAFPDDFMLHGSRQAGRAFKPAGGLLLGPRLARQPHQHLAQFRAGFDPFREFQPQGLPLRLHIHAIGIAAGAAPIGGLGAQQL